MADEQQFNDDEVRKFIEARINPTSPGYQEREARIQAEVEARRQEAEAADERALQAKKDYLYDRASIAGSSINGKTVDVDSSAFANNWQKEKARADELRGSIDDPAKKFAKEREEGLYNYLKYGAEKQKDDRDYEIAKAKLKQDEKKEAVAKAPNATQFQAAKFAKNAQQAQEELDRLEAEGFDPSSTAAAAKELVPNIVGNTGVVDLSKNQRYRQAKLQLINAVLRDETGAAATTEEGKKKDAELFGTGGDSPQTLANKRAARQQAIAGLKAEGVNAYDLIPKVEAPRVGQGQAGAATAAPSVSPQDQQALSWAKSNPNDPRSAQIIKRLEAKGMR
jgi:hypothetical protein